MQTTARQMEILNHTVHKPIMIRCQRWSESADQNVAHEWVRN